ncbi:hypothetical protein NC651_004522 [Populus alba x Populus x berolinensis]|nr:hypothetical protein NC651_004522 [Populus alba x Populus x berolinensis]
MKGAAAGYYLPELKVAGTMEATAGLYFWGNRERERFVVALCPGELVCGCYGLVSKRGGKCEDGGTTEGPMRRKRGERLRFG